MDKTKLKEAIELQIEKYQKGDFFGSFENNDICNLTKLEGSNNCYRCPLNVTTTKEVGDCGCLVRRNKECPQTFHADSKQIKRAITFDKNVLKLIDNFDINTKVFHYATKTQWAAALRALDLIL